MQYLPDPKSARLTAVLLLIISLILVYLLVFHWFIVKHRDYAAQVSDQRAQLGRYEAVAAQRDAMADQLRRIRESRQDSDLFLEGADFNEAAAGMSDRLGQMVRTKAGDDCQIVSRQPVRPRIEERYERVTVNVRMRCGGLDFLQVLYQLESEAPMVIVDDLNIIRPRARRRPGTTAAQTNEPLDIRFNMSAYLPAS
jgi:general secretion pathway protein M